MFFPWGVSCKFPDSRYPGSKHGRSVYMLVSDEGQQSLSSKSEKHTPHHPMSTKWMHIDGLVQGCSKSSALTYRIINALQLCQCNCCKLCRVVAFLQLLFTALYFEHLRCLFIWYIKVSLSCWYTQNHWAQTHTLTCVYQICIALLA